MSKNSTILRFSLLYYPGSLLQFHKVRLGGLGERRGMRIPEMRIPPGRKNGSGSDTSKRI